MNRQTIAELERLYRNREDIQRSREVSADRNFWLGLFNTVLFSEAGPRSSVINALGGTGQAADFFKRTVTERFEELQRAIDAEIEKLGGEP